MGLRHWRECFPDTMLKLAATRPQLDVVGDQAWLSDLHGRFSPHDRSNSAIEMPEGLCTPPTLENVRGTSFAREIIADSGFQTVVRKPPATSSCGRHHARSIPCSLPRVWGGMALACPTGETRCNDIWQQENRRSLRNKSFTDAPENYSILPCRFFSGLPLRRDDYRPTRRSIPGDPTALVWNSGQGRRSSLSFPTPPTADPEPL